MPIQLLIFTIFLSLLGIFLAGEVVLRRKFGLGNPLIYLPDPEIGYILAPNQQVRRLGNLIAINQYSMRSPVIEKTPPEGTWRILLLGDSVANGAWWTDQSQTISALMTNQLQATLSASLSLGSTEKTASNVKNMPVEVLNASANSWGPRNHLAFLRRMGTFGAKVVVLLINTDDLFAAAPSSLPVGRDRNYPDKKPALAWFELFTRYILPAPKVPPAPKEPGDPVEHNLEAIRQIKLFTQESNSHLLVAMTPLRRETGNTIPRDYEQKARAKLLEFTQGEKIFYLDFLPIFNRQEPPASLYRDHIHLSPKGNQLVSQTLCQIIQRETGLL